VCVRCRYDSTIAVLVAHGASLTEPVTLELLPQQPQVPSAPPFSSPGSAAAAGGHNSTSLNAQLEDFDKVERVSQLTAIGYDGGLVQEVMREGFARLNRVPSIPELMDALTLRGVQAVDQRAEQQFDSGWNEDTTAQASCGSGPWQSQNAGNNPFESGRAPPVQGPVQLAKIRPASAADIPVTQEAQQMEPLQAAPACNVTRGKAPMDMMQPSLPQGEMRCANCGMDIEKAMRCSKCKSVVYCGQKCQRENWKAHKPLCKTAVSR